MVNLVIRHFIKMKRKKNRILKENLTKCKNFLLLIVQTSSINILTFWFASFSNQSLQTNEKKRLHTPLTQPLNSIFSLFLVLFFFHLVFVYIILYFHFCVLILCFYRVNREHFDARQIFLFLFRMQNNVS